MSSLNPLFPQRDRPSTYGPSVRSTPLCDGVVSRLTYFVVRITLQYQCFYVRTVKEREGRDNGSVNNA